MEIKICGITTKEEAGYLNENDVNYAGFVFFEKSKRNLSIAEAQSIFPVLKDGIKKVAVMVSPTADFIKEVQESGIEILQIHKELSVEVLEAAKLPVWYAFNVADPVQLAAKKKFLEELPEHLAGKIEAIVVDAANYGSGETFDWTVGIDKDALSIVFKNRKFILAGGLKPSNVQEGIGIYHPDVVDVSSGVEGENGKKDRQVVKEFVGKVRSYE